jgi:hypothetical protein
LNLKQSSGHAYLPFLAATGQNFLLGAAAAWLAGGPCKSDFVKVPEVLIDVVLGVVAIRSVLYQCGVLRVEFSDVVDHNQLTVILKMLPLCCTRLFQPYLAHYEKGGLRLEKVIVIML